MTTRANFQGLNDGLHAEEISWEEYLAVLSGPELSDAKLVPLDPVYAPATVVTLTEGLNNGR